LFIGKRTSLCCCVCFLPSFVVVFFFFSYYQNEGCQDIIQYYGYVDSYCYYSGHRDTVKFDYPEKTVYSNNNQCSGTNVVTTSLMTDHCFDWIESYGYSNDDGLTAYGPYLTISYLSVKTVLPTVSPSLSPTATPSISLAPSYSMNPTVEPTSMSPSIIKPSTKPSIISTKNNSPQKPTFKPTRSPTLPFEDYQVDFKVSQVSPFSRCCCYCFIRTC
jgi:hypothetical protein